MEWLRVTGKEISISDHPNIDKDLLLYLLVVHHLHKLMIGQYNQRTMSMMQMTVVKAEL